MNPDAGKPDVEGLSGSCSMNFAKPVLGRGGTVSIIRGERELDNRVRLCGSRRHLATSGLLISGGWVIIQRDHGCHLTAPR